MTKSDEEVLQLLKVLTSPIKLGILLELSRHPSLTTVALRQSLGTSQPLLLIYLTQMRKAGLVTIRGKGHSTQYSIANPDIIEGINLFIASR